MREPSSFLNGPASKRRNDLEEKGGRGLKKAVMKPEPKENPAQRSSGSEN